MKLGITGPITIGAYKDYLDSAALRDKSIPQGRGGTSVVQLTLALLQQGCQLTIFTLDRTVSKELILEGANLKICVGPDRGARRVLDFYQVEREYLQEAIRREKPDLVHAHWTYEFALGALGSGLPTIVTARDAPLRVLQLMPSTYRFMRTLSSFKVVRQTQHLTAVSPYIAEYFRKVMRYPRPIKVIPNGMNA